jgi:cytidine deaminase (EC 3.5.4.5)
MIMNKETLIQEAREARNDSYSPYSEFNVGAVIQCADGSRYTGANIENINYTNTTHAEENAINSLFSTVLCVPERETGTMAGNCARIRPSTIAIDEQNTETARMLEEHGVSVVTVDTSEFQKSGGSVDCLFLRLP